MKKKLLSMTLATAMVVSCGVAVTAEDKVPTVLVDSSQIFFEDQNPVILGEGTTLVPARGVFEAMGASVDWDAEKRLVEVTSADNQTLIRLTIDDSTMKVYDLSGTFAALLSGQDFNAPETPVTLAVAPQIMNDRTMIPLRAISEALDAKVDWDGDKYLIDIKTTDAPTSVDGIPALSLSTNAQTVNAGENIELYINAKNIPADKFVSGVNVTLKYDPAKFEFVNSALVNGDQVIENALGAANPEFEVGYVKAAYITIDSATAAKTDGTIMKFTFKSISGQEGAFSISNSYHSRLGYNTSLLTDTEESNSTMFDGNDLVIDTSEVVVNSVAPTTTDAPSATTEPTTTPEPTATAEPTTTPEPTATAEPTTTPKPTATPAA